MSDLLVIFAGAIVAPVGFTISVLVVFVLARDHVRDWRRTFRKPSPIPTHVTAALDALEDAYRDAVFARELADLADCPLALPADQARLRSGAMLALIDSRSAIEECEALLQEHQS